MIQTETPYYQSNPTVFLPYPVNSAYNDPVYPCPNTGPGVVNTCAKALGLRVKDSSSVLIYGARLYSFFDNYDQSCLTRESCQQNMVSFERTNTNNFLYNLNTIGATWMVEENGFGQVMQADNKNGFASTIARWARQ